MKLRVILVEPCYAGNVGFVARAMLNFGASGLALVRPKCDFRSAEAMSRAMHAQHLLRKAKRFSILQSALKGADFVVGTTARTTPEKKLSRTALSVGEFAAGFAGSKAKIALVFGPEHSGLSNTDIAECDFIVRIPASKRYPSLNLSHAVAVVLYSLFAAQHLQELKSAKGAVRRQLVNRFAGLAKSCSRVRDKKATVAAFRALVSRAQITEKEANAVMAVLSGLGKRER